MITVLSYVALMLVVAQLYLMGSNLYRKGWWCALAACAVWTIWCLETEAWAMLMQQAIIAALSVRALVNLED